MKILIVTNTYPPADISGVGALVYELAKQLDADPEHEVKVLTREMEPRDPWVEAAGSSKRWFPFAAAWKGLRLCRQHHFDLIHVHESDGGMLCLILCLARYFRRSCAVPRVVATLQVSYDEEQRAVRPLRDHDGTVLSRPTVGEWVFRFFRAPVLSLFGWLTSKFSDAVVAPSRQTRKELVADYEAAVDKVIYNGVALPAQLPPSSEERQWQEAVVFYAGRLRTRKAVAVLVRAFVAIAESRPRASLWLAGDGEQSGALKRQIAELAEESNIDRLGSRIKFLGSKKPGEMAALYAAADIFCLPSIYEGLPLAILEAMAHGLPVVTTDVSGMPDAVLDGETGLLVPAEDSRALADALAELLDDPERRLSMGRVGRLRVEKEFTIEKIAGQYLALWGKLLGVEP